MKIAEMQGVLTAVQTEPDIRRFDRRDHWITVKPLLKEASRLRDTSLSIDQKTFEALLERIHHHPSNTPFTVKISVELVEHPPPADLHPAPSGGDNQGG